MDEEVVLFLQVKAPGKEILNLQEQVLRNNFSFIIFFRWILLTLGLHQINPRGNAAIFQGLHFLGFNLMPRRIPDFPDSFHSWNFHIFHSFNLPNLLKIRKSCWGFTRNCCRFHLLFFISCSNFTRIYSNLLFIFLQLQSSSSLFYRSYLRFTFIILLTYKI